jgi:hypothetical protein
MLELFFFWEFLNYVFKNRRRDIEQYRICIFRVKADRDYGSFRILIPVQSGHRFRLNPATIWG